MVDGGFTLLYDTNVCYVIIVVRCFYFIRRYILDIMNTLWPWFICDVDICQMCYGDFKKVVQVRRSLLS